MKRQLEQTGFIYGSAQPQLAGYCLLRPSSSSFLKASDICHVKKKIGLYFVLSLSQIWSLPPKFHLLEELFCSEESWTVSILWVTRAQNFRIITLELKIYFSFTFYFALFSLVTLNVNSMCGLSFIYVSWIQRICQFEEKHIWF